jgi:coiled-coil domain-containing protein 63/114
LEKLSALKKEAGSCRTFKKHVDNKNLQAVLDKIIAKYDQIAAVNSKLKREIDQLRK